MFIETEQQKITQKLIDEAIASIQRAFTLNNDPDDTRFGAAVITKLGNIYSSGQYFSDTYSLTVHAEQCALIHAAAHGEYDITAMAIISNKSGKAKTNPCHMCKQILYESHLRSGCNIELFLLDSQGNLVEKTNILSMISYPWPLNRN